MTITPYIILTLSTAGVFQFSVGHCRSILAAYADFAVSPRTRELACIAEGAMSGEDFGKLLGLIRLCPTRFDDSAKLAFVRFYFAALGIAGLVGGLPSRAARWMESERASCAHAAAVMLDRRVLASVSASATASKF